MGEEVEVKEGDGHEERDDVPIEKDGIDPEPKEDRLKREGAEEVVDPNEREKGSKTNGLE